MRTRAKDESAAPRSRMNPGVLAVRVDEHGRPVEMRVRFRLNA